MKVFKIACVQMNALKDDLDHNLGTHVKFIQKASKEKCKVVLFPELSVTAHYGDEKVVQYAEPADKGIIFDTIVEQARENRIVVSYGLCEIAHGTYYNSQVLVGPEGLIGIQRKVHASMDEYFNFRMGRSLEVFDIGFCKVGTLICYDSCFFEAWRALTLQGAEVILLPQAARSGWGKRIYKEKQLKSLRTWLKGLPGDYGVYTRSNAVFSVFANQADFNGHSTHSGGACVIDPLGNVLAKSKASISDLMITADLNPKVLAKARQHPQCTIKTRRPEVYGEVTKMI